MDAHDYPSLGRLARLNAQLAVQTARIESLVAAQLDDVERLFRAATEHDWDVVARLSQALAARPLDGDNKAMVRSAGRVCDALRRDPSGAKARRPLAKLLHECRSAKSRSA